MAWRGQRRCIWEAAAIGGGGKAPGRQANSVEKSREAIARLAMGHKTKNTWPRQEWSPRKEGSGAGPRGWQGMQGGC